MSRLLLALLVTASCALAQDVRITEFLPVNATGLEDETGVRQPWIEIWNPNPAAKVTLTNWRLSHAGTEWIFPSGTEIPPGEYMVVFADGQNRTLLTAPLHTNFTLSAAGGGPLQLLRATNPPTIASEFATYPALAPDVSYGRDRVEATQVGSYSNPTPGAANNYSGTGVSGKVTLDVSSRAFTGTLNVSLAQATPVDGAVIRYTVNGTAPLSSSPEYIGTQIAVTTTSLVRARIFEPGKLPGEVETGGYLLLNPTTTAFNTAAPIVVVSNFGLGGFPDSGDQPAYMWVWQPGADGRARFTDLPTIATRCAVDRRGSSTIGNAKTNFNLEVRKNRDDDDKGIALLGMPEGSDWVFHAPFDFDRSLLHNPFAYALSNSIGRYAPRNRMAEVFVETTGQSLNYVAGGSGDYYGVYNVLEKIRRGKDRVNIAKLDTYDNDAVSKTGGYIFKVDRQDSGDSGFGAGGQSFAYYYPKEIEIKTPQRDPQEKYLTSYINSYKAALDSANYKDPVTGYAAWLDVPAAIDHHLINVWAFNVDGLRLSGYLHKDRGGKITFGPVWDFDRALSSTDGRDANPATWRSQSSDLGTDFFNFTWWNRMFTDPDFYQRYIDRWVELRRGAFSPAAIDGLIDALNAELTAEGVARDLQRWGRSKRSWTRPFPPNNTLPASQAAEVQRLKDYLQQRANFFNSQWVAPVTFSAAGGNVQPGLSLTMTAAANATIYYTLDGTDPRPSGGGAPSGGNVLIYSEPITINSTTRVRARAYNASWTALTGANNPPLVSKWSGPTNSRFSTDPLASAANLAVTEVNFHPADPSAAELAINPRFDTSDFEFIELKNIGATAIDLGDVQLALGATFAFTNDVALTLQPGQFVILAANPTAFNARYGAVANVVGSFRGDLNNSGERLILNGSGGGLIADFTYDDGWYAGTDGGGRTLAIYNPTAPSAAFSTAANWRASAAIGGSPGANEPNLAPVASAGSDLIGILPSVTIPATADDDTQPAPFTIAWSALTGPGAVSFAPANAAATTATFDLPGIYTLRLTVNDSALSALDDLMVTMRDTPGAWLLRHPGIGTLNDDRDSDGRTNFFEWALNLDPQNGAGGDGSLVTTENGRLTLTYTRQKASSFVAYTVQATSDVAAWADPQPGEITETVLADDGVTQTVKATDNAPAGTQRFIRLKVAPLP